MPIIGIVIAIIVVLGGGTSLVAQTSLPGDALYPVKINVNEEAQAFLQTSIEAKARWEVERAERRLEEAEELTVKSTVTVDARMRIEENFSQQAERVKARIKKLEEIDARAAANIRAEFETSLKAHVRILTNLATQNMDKDEAKEIDHLTVVIEDQVHATTRARMESKSKASVELRVDVQAAAERNLTAAENKIAEVRAFIEANKNRASAEASVAAQAKLTVAEGLVVRGKTKMDAKAYNEAFILFQEALLTSQEAKLLLDAHLRLDIDLSTEGESNVATGTERSGIKIDGGVGNIKIQY